MAIRPLPASSRFHPSQREALHLKSSCIERPFQVAAVQKFPAIAGRAARNPATAPNLSVKIHVNPLHSYSFPLYIYASVAVHFRTRFRFFGTEFGGEEGAAAHSV